MRNYSDIESLPKREQFVFFIIDTSGGMYGERISAINAAMKAALQTLEDIQANDPATVYKIAVMEFNSVALWLTLYPIPVCDIEWSPLSAGGCTDWSKPLAELNSKLSRREFFNSTLAPLTPVIIWITDDAGAADCRWECALKGLSNNRWYQASVKCVFSILVEQSPFLAELVGDEQSIIPVSNLSDFDELISSVLLKIFHEKYRRQNSDNPQEPFCWENIVNAQPSYPEDFWNDPIW